MILDDLGVGGGNLTVSGIIFAVVTWIWRKVSSTEEKVSTLELKIAENYVTRPELKVLEDKLDRYNDVMGAKIDNVNNNILNLSTIITKRE